MEIPYHEAYFGEKNRAHAVLGASCEDSVARNLAHELDLPGQTPPGFLLKSYISGFPFENNFVIARTSTDPVAGRKDMVFSHAILIALNEIGRLSDIRMATTRLLSTRPNRIMASSGTFQITNDTAFNRHNRLGVIGALLDVTREQTVLSDSCDFEEIIEDIWEWLLPSLRPAFSFRTFFSPEDAAYSRSAVICTPQAMISRWPASQILESPDRLVGSNSPAIDLLSGRDARDFATFLSDLQFTVRSFGDLSKASKAFVRYSTPNAKFADLLGAARLISAIQPDQSDGEKLKKALVDKISSPSLALSLEDILRLRNFDASAFKAAHEIWGRMKLWISDALSKHAEPSPFPKLFEGLAFPDQTTPSWRAAFIDAYRAVESSSYEALAGHIWQSLVHLPGHVRLILTDGPDPSVFDAILCEQVQFCHPNESAVGLRRVLRERKFAQTEAEFLCVVLAGGAEEAIARLSKRGSDPATCSAIDRAISHLNAEAVVALPFNVNHTRLLDHAASLIATDPRLLEGIDFLSETGQSLWLGALRTAEEPASLIGKSCVNSLLNHLLSGGIIDVALIDEMSKCASTGTEILAYPRRKEIWAKLPEPARSRLLNTAASAWIGQLEIGRFLDTEDELSDVVGSNDNRSRLLIALRSCSMHSLIKTVGAVKTLGQREMEPIIRSYLGHGTLTADELEHLGRTILTRGWRDIVRSLAGSHASDNRLRPLFSVCSEFVPFLARWSMNLSSPSRDDLWSFLLDTASELFPGGPNDRNLWERAGGDAADLSMTGSGRSSWELAIGQIRRGGRVRVKALIERMADDYPNSPSLQYLERERPN